MPRRLSSTAVAQLRAMIEADTPYRLICERFGCGKPTVSYYAALMGLAKSKRKHDWLAVRAYYEAGNSGNATRQKFGVLRRTWQEAVKRGDIIPRPPRAHVRTILQVISAGSVCRTHLRNRLVREGLLIYECAFCRIYEWRGQPLSLELDHINGDKTDNRLENLRILCPNCHSQTETFSGRNATRRKAS